MSIYCEGSQCKKRDKCALHCVEPGDYEYIDWSTYGGGQTWSDETGSHVDTWCECGDASEFKHFKPIDKNIVSIHDCSMRSQYYTASMILPKVEANCSDRCFTQECVEKIIDNLKSTKGLHIISITNSETEDIVTFEVDSSIL